MGKNPCFIARQRLPEYPYLPRCGFRQPKKHPHDGRLAGSVSPEQPVNPPGLYMQAGSKHPRLLPIFFSQIIGFYHVLAHGCASFPSFG